MEWTVLHTPVFVWFFIGALFQLLPDSNSQLQLLKSVLNDLYIDLNNDAVPNCISLQSSIVEADRGM